MYDITEEEKLLEDIEDVQKVKKNPIKFKSNKFKQ